MKVPTLTTEQLILRPLCIQDARAVFRYASDPHVTAFVPWQPHPTQSHTRRYIHTQQQTPHTLTWAIVLQKNMTVIGECTLSCTQPAQAELHYILAQHYWGYGFATQAAHAIKTYAFEHLAIITLHAWIVAQNHKSINVARRLGMQCEMVIEQQWYNGKTYDDVHMYTLRRQ